LVLNQITDNLIKNHQVNSQFFNPLFFKGLLPSLKTFFIFIILNKSSL